MSIINKFSEFRDSVYHAVTHRDKVVEDITSKLTPAEMNNPKVQKNLEALRLARSQSATQRETSWLKRELEAPIASEKLPIGMKIFAWLCIVAAAGALLELVPVCHVVSQMLLDGEMDKLGISTVVVTFVFLFDLLLLDIGFAAFGVMLLSGKRVYAALLIYALYILLLAGAICALMLYGVRLQLLIYLVMFALMVALQTYLDPGLRAERHLQRLLHDKELKRDEEEGILGRDVSGKGFIELNFFNLFWIFVVCSIIGDAMETVFHVTIVDPGHWQDRAGLMYGPFSPIYGFGACLMTIGLNRLYKDNVVVIFFLSAIIGGAFEYFVSVWMQYTYGAVAWDYTGQFLSIGGRTCGWAMGCWGLLGVVFIKVLLPWLLWIVNKIPWNWRYTVTTVAATLMAADCVITLMALDCWYERVAGQPVETHIQKFFAEHYDNTYMADRFESMTIDPSNAVRDS